MFPAAPGVMLSSITWVDSIRMTKSPDMGNIICAIPVALLKVSVSTQQPVSHSESGEGSGVVGWDGGQEWIWQDQCGNMSTIHVTVLIESQKDLTCAHSCKLLVYRLICFTKQDNMFVSFFLSFFDAFSFPHWCQDIKRPYRLLFSWLFLFQVDKLVLSQTFPWSSSA